MSKATGGFASMSKERHAEVTSKGGKEAWRRGKAYRFDAQKAAEAGRKGGSVSRRPAHTYAKRVPEGEQLV